jgi:acyl carrier protein
MWREVLGSDRVGVADHYDDLEVDSLLAASIFVEIEETFAISLPIAALVDAPREIDELISRRLG